jgi:hypothetical protein
MIKSLKITATRIIKYTDDENREQVFVKYWLDVFMCQVFNDHQRPLRDEWIVDNLFSGWLRKFVARAVAKKDLSFIYSLQKGTKRMWPVLGHKKEYLALQKHALRLGEPHGPLPDDLDLEIEKTSLEVFQRTNTLKSEPIKMVPSGSACIQASRHKGGALSMFEPFEPDVSMRTETAKRIGKLRSLNMDLSIWRQRTFDKARSECQTFREGMLDLEVVPVPEPSKFRIITKGDGYLYTALQPLQGLMLSDWKRHSASTMKEEDLTEKVRKIDQNCRTLEYFCSVDYEAATDLLKKQATLACFRPLKEAPCSDLAWLALIGSGTVRYPKVEGLPQLPEIDLVDGQLMGHPLSFPMLCTINLAVFRTAIKRWIKQSPNSFERRCRRERGRAMWDNVIVNGDDMLFKCEWSFYDIFCKTAKDAGLKLSLGKNYLSRDMCMINSQTFKRVGKRMERVGYLNMKFIKGTSLKEGDSSALPTQIGKDVNKMIKYCPWTKCTIPSIFGRWKEDWLGKCYIPNWYLPVHLGGFGIDLNHAPSTWKLTREQRKVAVAMYSNPTMTLYRTMGFKLPLAVVAGSVLSWKRVQDTCPLREHDTDGEDPWLVRLALAYRYGTHGRKPSESGLYKNTFDLRGAKPCSFDKLIELWRTKLISVKGPECPPLNLIRI